ncbi:MAG: lipid-binding SYLF domain-containing protein, partial [Proteobacteria bacterium]|nr:lipid-binding SYLF domain-containing protein [Pseudomonadota bacterium]
MPSAIYRIQLRATSIRIRSGRGIRALSLALIVSGLTLAPAAITPAVADDAADARELVDKAKQTIENFKADPDMGWFRDNLPDAQAVMVVPVLIKAGFIFGGSGGHGVVLWRDAASGRWSYPSFTFMGSITFGLQIGGEAAEVVLMIRSDKGGHAPGLHGVAPAGARRLEQHGQAEDAECHRGR